MRTPTQEEVDRWLELAKARGFLNEKGEFGVGRYVMEPDGDGIIVVFITPVAAGPEDEELKPKTPPIMFDRTPDGRILLPGRWWVHMLEQVAQDERVPETDRHGAWVASRSLVFSNVYLPAGTETIAILAPDRDGNLVPHEALIPETRVRVQIILRT